MVLGSQAHAGELLIETALADDGALLVSYTPPAGVTELQRTRTDEVSNGFWQRQIRSLDDCAQVEPTRIILHPSANCDSARLRVEPMLIERNAQYEAALPMKGQGLLSFTEYYVAAVSGHSLHWR